MVFSGGQLKRLHRPLPEGDQDQVLLRRLLFLLQSGLQGQDQPGQRPDRLLHRRQRPHQHHPQLGHALHGAGAAGAEEGAGGAGLGHGEGKVWDWQK